MSSPCFTPASARRALTRVRPATERLTRLYRGLEAMRPSRVQSDQAVDARYFALLLRVHATLREMAQLGVRVGDPRRGTIDFPARRNGRPVLLCWQLGEASLNHWHEPGAGLAGRRPVDEDGPWEGGDTVPPGDPGPDVLA